MTVTGLLLGSTIDCSGLPVPIETALETAAQAGCRSEVSIERAEGRMPAASVRRDGTGSPEPARHETE
jgi:hypothetical protein